MRLTSRSDFSFILFFEEAAVELEAVKDDTPFVLVRSEEEEEEKKKTRRFTRELFGD